MDKLDLKHFIDLKSSWEFLSETQLPIFMYGMGDGAMKILSRFAEYGIACSGFFASDEFVRGHSFMGYRVHKLSEIEQNVSEFVVVLGFAAGYESLIEKIKHISQKHILVVPDIPVFGDNLFTKKFLADNFDKITEVYNMLADEESKQVMKNVLKFKITGDIKYLEYTDTKAEEVFNNLLEFKDNEIYVDAGAYKGDTIEQFFEYCKSPEKIYAIEPDRRNYKKLFEKLSEDQRISFHNNAVWSTNTELTFSDSEGRQSAVAKQGHVVCAESIDNILEGRKATYIKYDVEGCEYEALKGTASTIKNYSPKMMVALYHRSEDIFSIPLYIKSINPEYKYYIRKFQYIPAWEINLICM